MSSKVKNVYWERSSYYYRKRVPKRFAHVDGRQVHLVCLHTKDIEAARRKAVAVENEVMAAWEAKAAGRDQDAEAALKAARKIASAYGFTYKSVLDLAKAPLDEILARMDAITSADGATITAPPEVAQAILGAHPETLPKLSVALEEFFDLTREQRIGKTEAQEKRWKLARRRALGDLISVIGDLELDKITRAEVMKFRAWWMDRIETGHSPGTPNKYISYLSKFFRTWCDINDVDLDNPFKGIKFAEPVKAENPVFSPAWISKRILAKGALDGLNMEARNVLLIMINTGARPSEILGLEPGDIVLGDIPHIAIRANVRGDLKTGLSRRDIPLAGVSLTAAKHFKKAGCAQKYLQKNDGWSAVVNKYMKTNGLRETPNHTAYTLRHSFETRLMDAKCDERLRIELMGHSYNRPKYGAVSLDLLADEIEKIAL